MGMTGWADSAESVGESQELWAGSQGHRDNLGQHFRGGGLPPAGWAGPECRCDVSANVLQESSMGSL